MTQTIPGWYDTPGAMEALGVSRPAISKLAKSEGWQSVKIGSGENAPLLHAAADVHDYRGHQIRTRLVKALGWKGRGLYRVSDIDISCPVCEVLAIEWPAPPYLAEKYLCVEGHEGVLL